MVKLNKDVLFIVLKELVSDKNWIKSSTLTKIEKKSLHSCLFVNRIWCQTAIPILWNNPWKFVVNKILLFNVIISFLSKESLNFISSQGINLTPILHTHPLFDYISYCKYITYQNIESCINEVKFDKDYQLHVIKQEIYKLLISKCSAKFLDVVNAETHLKHPIYHFTGAKISLGTLSYLYCDSSIDSAFFYGLSYVCKLLQKIYITSCPDDNLGLARLIEVQKNLKCFICSISPDDEIYIPQHKEIGNALVKQSNSLLHFKLMHGENFFFPLNILSNFNNLQKLKLTYFDENDYQLEKQLESSAFPKLEVFNIGVITLNIAIKIIEKTEGNLSNIILGYTIYEEEYSGQYIRTIYERCPNIKTLSLGVTDNDYVEFENLLKKCQLERMIIEGSFRKNTCAKLLLDILSRSAPKNLKEIRFFNDWIIIPRDLELFFENWRGRKQISLYFFVSDDEYAGFTKDSLEVLRRYEEEGVIKNYHYDGDYQEFYFSW